MEHLVPVWTFSTANRCTFVDWAFIECVCFIVCTWQRCRAIRLCYYDFICCLHFGVCLLFISLSKRILMWNHKKRTFCADKWLLSVTGHHTNHNSWEMFRKVLESRAVSAGKLYQFIFRNKYLYPREVLFRNNDHKNMRSEVPTIQKDVPPSSVTNVIYIRFILGVWQYLSFSSVRTKKGYQMI